MTIDRKKLRDWGLPALLLAGGALAWTMGWIPALGGETAADPSQPVRAADFQAQAISGGPPLSLAAHRGEVVLVNFWATWCPPCRVEIPGFAALYDRYRAKGFTIIGLALDQEGAAAVAPYVREHGIPYPVGLGHQGVVADYGGIRGIPTSFLIDRQGRIVKKYVGLLPSTRLERDLQALL